MAVTKVPEGADLYLTITELDNSHHAGITLHIAQKYITPSAYYLSNGKPHPLWLVSTIEAYAAKRAEIAAATAALNGVA